MMYLQQPMMLQLSFYALLLTFLIQRHHFLMSLFSLEGMMLILVAMIPLSTTILNMSMSTVSIMMLTLGACEASLGLSLLVMMSRHYGNDSLMSLNMNKC